MIVGIDYKVRVPNRAELTAVQELRHAVLDPLRDDDYELTLGLKDYDVRTIHVAAFAGERVISTVRLDPLEDDIFAVRKMATVEELRGKRVGPEVLRFAEALAFVHGRARGFTVDSREEAIPFFTRQGYSSTGEPPVVNFGVQNFTMFKRGLSDG
jgi:GNAT superfamily N-acetyltransferase